MGQSTDAILFYGYVYEDEGSAPWAGEAEQEEDDEDDWEDRWARANGIAEPSVEYGDEPRDVTTPARLIHQAYWKAKRELIAATPVRVDTHCSDACPMYYVAVKATITLARRGNPKRIGALDVPEGAAEQLRAFMERMGMPRPPGQDAPGWWLVSDWC